MKKQLVYLGVLCLLLLNGCKVNYSFSGGDVGNAETVSVAFFPNHAPLIQPNLSQVFTEQLKDIFIQQTQLDLVSADGDLQLEGSITGYDIQPIAAQANETAAQSRLTITVNVLFTNTLDEKKNFEQSFNRFADFESDQDLSEIEDQLIQQISFELSENIFNKAVVNW